MLRKRTTSLSSKSNLDRLNEIRSSNCHDHDHDHDHSSSSGLRSSGREPRSTFRLVILIFFISTFVFLLYFQQHVPLSSSLSLSTAPFIRSLMEGNSHDDAHAPPREIISKNLNNDENISTAKVTPLALPTQTLFDDEPFIHIINTRFMQQQGNLTTLAEARLHLFETFTLPSIMEQSSQKFIWVIKVDPHLDKTILEKLVGMIQDAVAVSSSNKKSDNVGDGNNDGNGNNKDNNGFGERVFVVSSNKNYKHNYGSWRGGAEMREVLSHADADIDITTSLSSASISSRGGIHSGNIHLLHRIKDLEASKIMLQTRLDADDGLHLKYLEHIQKDALERFVVPAAVPVPAADTAPADTKLTTATSIHPSSTKWFYWCSGIHVKWYLDGEGEHGQLHTEKNTQFCITPGLTLGFNVGTKIEEVPIYMHHKLYKNLATVASAATAIAIATHLKGGARTGMDKEGKDLSCKTSQSRDGNHHQGGGGQQCLMVMIDFFGAIRARTSTSAGMSDVDSHAGKMDNTSGAGAVTTDGIRSSEDQKRADFLWQTVRNRFHVSMGQLADTKAYFLKNSRQIAKENLEGQCTKGHSCKKSSKNQLKKLLLVREA